MKNDPTDKAERAAAELRALTRAAHEAAQDLRAAMREARAQVDGYLHDEVQKALDHYTSVMQAEVSGWNADARADSERVTRSLRAALDSVCTVIVRGLRDPNNGAILNAEIVIDLRGQVPVMVPADSPQGRATLAEAQYQIVLGPNAGPMPPDPS